MDQHKNIKVWYDPEGDFLEVVFEKKAGYFVETESDSVMEKVDEEGNMLGFSIQNVSQLKNHPLDLNLPISNSSALIP